MYDKILPALFEIQDKCEWIPIAGDTIKAKKKAIEYLQLKEGDKVLVTSIGAGFELDFIVPKIGNSGMVVGIDFSEGMLKKTQEKVDKKGWKNVRLVKMDLNEFSIEKDLEFIPDVILSNFGYLTEEILLTFIKELKEDGRIAISGPQPLRGARKLLYPITFIPEMIFGLTWSSLQMFPLYIKTFSENLKDVEVYEDTFGKYFVAVAGKK